jgi:hypothetical protein
METNQDLPVSSLTLRLNSRKAFSDQWGKSFPAFLFSPGLFPRAYYGLC